jgi:acyl-homoserine-lactone acylase
MELIPNMDKIDMHAVKKIKFNLQLPSQLGYPHNIDSLFLLSTINYPEISALINTLNGWDKIGAADSKGGAIFLLAYIFLEKQWRGKPYRTMTTLEAVETLVYVKDYMMKNFGTTNIKLGDIQKLVRGEKEWPLGGFPDLLAPQWTTPLKNGKLKSIGGDGLIMFVKFPKTGLPIIETINMYGASSHPESKHFDDQVEMYLQQKTKKMTLDKATVYKNAERIYAPGE